MRTSLPILAAVIGASVAAAALPPSETRVRPGPLVFEANGGRLDPRVRFVARGAAYAAFLTAGDVVLPLGGHSARSSR